MQVVADQLAVYLRRQQGRADEAGLPMVEGSHGVVQVRRMAQSAGVDDFHDLFIRRRAVSQRHENLMVPAILQKVFVLQYFRRYGDDLHDVSIGRNPGKIGSREVPRRLGPL